MGYGFYTLPDGREAGYSVEATCDKDGCETKIDRGLAYLCGQNPDGWRDTDEPGCGNYYCDPHCGEHNCPNAQCGKHSTDGSNYCTLVSGHEGAHHDRNDDTRFTETEDGDND